MKKVITLLLCAFLMFGVMPCEAKGKPAKKTAKKTTVTTIAPLGGYYKYDLNEAGIKEAIALGKNNQIPKYIVYPDSSFKFAPKIEVITPYKMIAMLNHGQSISYNDSVSMFNDFKKNNRFDLGIVYMGYNSTMHKQAKFIINQNDKYIYPCEIKTKDYAEYNYALGMCEAYMYVSFKDLDKQLDLTQPVKIIIDANNGVTTTYTTNFSNFK